MKGAGIRRYNRPERDFMLTHRSFARMGTKTGLSMRGRTVGLYVLSHDHGYVQTQESIARHLELAVRTVAGALLDLEEAGLLVRVEERNARGHRTGTAMHISDVPFTEAERAELRGPLPAKSADAESPSAKSAGPKKSNSKQESKTEEDQPSGGSAAAPNPEPNPSPEDAMTKPAAQAGLWDQEPPAVKPKRRATALPEGAAAVVASFVESYQANHDGRRPLGSDIGKVASAAKLILRREEATQEQLVACAATMGRGEWSNLAQELKFSLKRTPQSTMPRAMLQDDPGWADVVSTVQGDDVSDAEFAELFAVGA